MNKSISFFTLVYLLVLLGACNNDNKPIIFSAIGDVPYTKEMADDLERGIEGHNKNPTSSFLIHLGDIKSGGKPCNENIYEDVSGQLKKSKTPVFIIPGDNEYNDCTDPVEAFSFWNKYFFHFNEHWKTPWTIGYQDEQKENFTWVEKEVIFVGLNLVGGRVHDSTEWGNRLKLNADWIDKLVAEKSDDLKAMVVFGHANMNGNPEKFETFVKRFRATAQVFKKPILYLQGDGHSWIKDRPWKEQNIFRVQVDAGAKILQIKVDTRLDNPFIFNNSGISSL